MRLWTKRAEPTERRLAEMPTDEDTARALARALRMDDSGLYDWIEASLAGVHMAVDAHRFRGAPVAEVDKAMMQLHACVLALTQRGD